MTTPVENLIIGSGPSALAAAMALRARGCTFEVIDAGFDLEPSRQSLVDRLGTSDHAAWSAADRSTLFPPARASAKGVEKRYAFGSDFPYRLPPFLDLTAEDCVVDVSHGVGGFGNVWGAAVLPWVDADLADWPIRAADMEASYRDVLGYMPVSSSTDGLEQHFPTFGAGTHLELSEQGRMIAAALDRRKPALLARGVHAGRSRVAVESRGGESSCRYCGLCLDGCAYGSIFNPRNHWKRLTREGVVMRQGVYALEFREHADGVDVVVLDVVSGRADTIRAKRVFLGAGALNSTRIVARSLGLQGRAIALKDSQYFFFPLLSWQRAAAPPSFTLAELFVEVRNAALSPYFTHFQVYGLNPIFRQALRAMLPSVMRRPALLKELEGRFYLFQGFLHSEHSGSLELTLTAAEPARDRVRIRGVPNADSLRIARGAQRLLRRQLAGFGVIPPVYLNMVPLGRSFHIGGSFPMGGRDPVFRADRTGRPAGLERVHLIDACTFPTIPATTITFSIMAQADRVVRETLNGAMDP